MTLKPFGTKLDENLIIDLKIRSARTQTTVHDIVDQALREYLGARSDADDNDRDDPSEQ